MTKFILSVLSVFSWNSVEEVNSASAYGYWWCGMKILSLFTLAAVFYLPHSNAQSPLCEGHELTETQLTEIIRKERATNPKIPRSKISEMNSKPKVKITPRKCFYHYSEQNGTDDLIVFGINRKERIVYYRKPGYGSTEICYLNFKPLNQEMLAEKLKFARVRDSSIPKEPKQYTVRMNKTVCTYLYTEEMGMGAANVFVFAASGEIVDSWVEPKRM